MTVAFFFQTADITFDLDGADRVAQIAANAAFGRSRSKQQLVLCDLAHEVPVPFNRLAVLHRA